VTFISILPMDFVELTPLSIVLLRLPITLIWLCLGLVVLRLAIHSLSFFLWVRATLPCFYCNVFGDPNSLFLYLNFYLIWKHINKQLLVRRFPRNPSMFECTYVVHCSTSKPDIARSLWNQYLSARCGRYWSTQTPSSLSPNSDFSISFTSHHSFEQGRIPP